MSERRADRPIAIGRGFGIRRHRPARAVVAALVLTAAVAVLTGPALAAGLEVKVQLPQKGFPIKPVEPNGSWKLKRAATVTANCQPSGSATGCPATFTLYAAQLGPAPGLPAFPLPVQLSQIKMTLLPGQQQTVKLRFVLSHKVLDVLYAYPDPRCYVQTVITSGGPSSQAQPQLTSTSSDTNIR